MSSVYSVTHVPGQDPADTFSRKGRRAPAAAEKCECHSSPMGEGFPPQYPLVRSTTLRSGSPRSKAAIWRAMAATMGSGAEIAALWGLT